jgi:hypothetical protein
MAWCDPGKNEDLKKKLVWHLPKDDRYRWQRERQGF